MFIGVSVLTIVSLLTGIVIGKSINLKKFKVALGELEDTIASMATHKGILLKQLKNCRERSSIRRDEIESLTESMSACKNEKQQMRKELYAYRKKYGELN